MPTVEQLYTIIGAKDGMIYDLQLSLVTNQQEMQKKDQRIAELESMTYPPEPQQEVEPVAEEQVQPLRRIQARRQNIEQDIEDDMGATFKPRG
jgi:hypothetical protein